LKGYPLDSRLHLAYIPTTVKQLLTGKEVENVFGIKDETLRYWRSAGIGPKYVRLGRSVLYDGATIKAYIAQHEVTPSVLAAMEERHGSL
jgi:predicted DNA-binding transcriptional regulator AlpA